MAGALVTTNDFTGMGSIRRWVKVGDTVIHRFIEYLWAHLTINSMLLRIICHLRQVKLLLLIQHLDVLVSFITGGRIGVVVVFARSREVGWRLNFWLAVIRWKYGSICNYWQSLIEIEVLLSSFLLLIKLLLDGAIQFFAALSCRDSQLLLLVEGCLRFHKVLICALWLYYWLIWLLLLICLLLELLVLLQSLDAADALSWEVLRKGYRVKLLLELEVRWVRFSSLCCQLLLWQA